MATILLLHSAYGLRPAMHEIAEDLRTRGHHVVLPDFYDGHVFSDAEGIIYRDRIGPKALLHRLAATIDDLPQDAALAGFSLGSAFAQHLASTRPTARGAFLFHSAARPRGPWSGVPVQVHRYATDDWINEDDVAALGTAVRAVGASFEDHVVDGTGHLFTDSGDPDHHPAATRRALDAVDAALRGPG